MNPMEKARVINYGRGAQYARDALAADLREDFAAHFCDSIDYQPEALVNGVRQRLIVSRNKNVVSEKKIIAYPGETFYTGDVVDCFGAKWLITEVEQNKEIYTSGKMEQCNRELIWQNPQSGKIMRRWCTVEKPYYSNLDKTVELTVSNRQFKI